MKIADMTADELASDSLTQGAVKRYYCMLVRGVRSHHAWQAMANRLDDASEVCALHDVAYLVKCRDNAARLADAFGPAFDSDAYLDQLAALQAAIRDTF